MKKSVIYVLCGLLGFCSLISVKASSCTTSEQSRLKEIDPSMYLTGPDIGYEPVYDEYFKVFFSNVTGDIYIKITNDYNDDVKFIRYKDTDDGIYTFDWEYNDKITKFKYEVYSSAETSCPDEKYYTGYVILPKYNDFSTRVMCEGLNDLPECQKYVTKDYNPVEQEKTIVEYLKQKEIKEEEEQKKWYVKIGDFVNNHKGVIITCSIIVVSGVATVVVVNKKRKRVK